MAADGFCLPDDVLVQILLLIPASSRWPLRLVCKGWRSLIDERAAPGEKIPSKILVFINHGRSSSAVVFDAKNGRRTHKWTYTSSIGDDDDGSVHIVGTCNGLLCLHDGGSTSSAVKVTNPITGDTLVLPPPVPTPPQFTDAPGKYSFGFHPETRQHKVVYIPTSSRSGSAYTMSVDALRVFTVGGDTAWRSVPVPTPGACDNLMCEPVSAAGCTYWLPAASGRVMALDLKDERVTSFDLPPARPAMIPSATRDRWWLTKIHARLGVVAAVGMPSQTRMEVWVRGGGGGKKKPGWSRRCSVVRKAASLWVMAPQLRHGDCILSASRDVWDWRRQGMRTRLFRHKVGDLMDGGDRGSRLLEPPKGTELVLRTEESEGELTTFAYVETTNPVPRATTSK